MHPLRYAHDLLYFGRSSAGRFYGPGGEYGTLYAALDPRGAFLETFARDVGLRVVSRAALAENVLVRLPVGTTLGLVDLTGAGARRIGADARLTTGDYRVAQRWSLALWEHPQRPDGIYWRSRFDDDRFAVALFDRAGAGVEPEIVGMWDSPAVTVLLADILDAYGIGLA